MLRIEGNGMKTSIAIAVAALLASSLAHAQTMEVVFRQKAPDSTETVRRQVLPIQPASQERYSVAWEVVAAGVASNTVMGSAFDGYPIVAQEGQADGPGYLMYVSCSRLRESTTKKLRCSVAGEIVAREDTISEPQTTALTAHSFNEEFSSDGERDFVLQDGKYLVRLRASLQN